MRKGIKTKGKKKKGKEKKIKECVRITATHLESNKLIQQKNEMQKEEQRFCNLGRIDGEATILNCLERTGKKKRLEKRESTRLNASISWIASKFCYDFLHMDE